MATLPIGPGFSFWEPNEEEPGYDSETVSGRRRFRSHGFTRWRILCGWRDLTPAEVEPIRAFLRARGQEEIFQVHRPDGMADTEVVTSVATNTPGGSSFFTVMNLADVLSDLARIRISGTPGEYIVIGYIDHAAGNLVLLNRGLDGPVVRTANVFWVKRISVRRVGEIDQKLNRNGRWDINIELLEELSE